MRISNLGLAFSIEVALGALICLSEHGRHFSPTIQTSRQFLVLSVFHSGFWLLQVQSSGLGHCKRDSDWYF